MRAALLSAFLFILGAAQCAAECQPDKVLLRGPWGTAKFVIELADSPEERSRGLMFRETLPVGAGMLFVYEKPQRASFWMKNTLISLDMLFIDLTGTVLHVHHKAIPGDLSGIEGGNDVFAVLEINGGLAETYGIDAGSEVQHAVFSSGPAIWPC